MTVTAKTGPYVPGPGGFATSVQWRPPPIQAFPKPRLSAGLRLHGEYQGSGFTEPKYIARRGDGQVVQLSRLLHLVAAAIDGTRDTDQISRIVSGEYGREVSEENVFFLIDKKLVPLGVAVPWDQEDDEVDAPRSDLLLALKGHKVIFGEERANAIGRGLAWLHRPVVVALTLLSAVAMDVWLFGFHGAITPVLQVLDQPLLMLAVFGLTVASLVFHEFGHASACRYGGARPGCIGCGLFLIWPSMYTDVTDVYRIGRAGRLRTDLGGVYFNVVFMLGLFGCYLLTGQPFFLSAVYLGHFEVLEQLMPAVRLDGYYILGDLAGVPDLYGKIKPILRSMLPGRPTPPEVTDLKKSARTVVTIWVVTMVPLLLGDLSYALWNLPRIVSTGVRSLTQQLVGTFWALTHGQPLLGLVGVLGSLMLICPLAGMVYLSIRLTGRLLRAVRQATADSPRLRISLSAVGATALGALCCAWVIGITPKPLPPQPPILPVLQPGVPTVYPTTGSTVPTTGPTAPATPGPHTTTPSPKGATHAGSASPSATPPRPTASISSGTATGAVTVPTTAKASPTASVTTTTKAPTTAPTTTVPPTTTSTP